MPEFNREMLTLARESRELTQTRFAEIVGVSQAEISKFETGLRIPNPELQSRLAHALGYSENFFCLNESIRAFGSGCVYHRKRQSASETKLQFLLASINVKRIQVKQLLKSVDSRARGGFEHLDIDEHSGANEVASKLRMLWKLPPGPVQNLVRTVEDAGGIVIRFNFGTSKVDALSQWIEGCPPVFLINDAIPTDRMRFTLAHEIGHIVMHRVISENMEREADAFAAEFLMPETQIRPHLSFVNLQKLASLKPYWRVSMNALLYRAAQIGTIDQRTKSYLWMKMGQAGYRTNEPVQIAPEQPSSVAELISVHQNVLGYDWKSIDTVICEPDGFSDLRTPQLGGGGLHLVK